MSVRRESGATLKIDSEEMHGMRLMRLGGSPNQVYECIEACFSDENAKADEKIDVRLHLPSPVIGTIIGRGGTNIKMIRDLSRAEVQVEKTPPGPQPPTRSIDGRGSVCQLRNMIHELVRLLLQEHGPQAVGPLQEGRSLNHGQHDRSRLQDHRQSDASRFQGHAYVSEPRPDAAREPFKERIPERRLPLWGTLNPSSAPEPGSRGASPRGPPVRRGASSAAKPQGVIMFELSNDLAGLLIGQRGATINHVRKTSGARLEVTEAQGSGGRERLVAIDGTQRQVDECICEIFEVFASPQEDRRNHHHVSEDNAIEVVLILLSFQMGAVIGEGGRNISSIRSESGARVRVEQGTPTAKTAERTALVSGRPLQVQKALRMVAQILFEEGRTERLDSLPPREKRQRID